MAAMEIDPVEYRLSCVLRGHEDDVRGICICGESGIATSSRDRTVRLWTADSDEKHKYSLSKTLAGHTSFVGPLAWIAPSDQFPQGAVVSGGMDTQVLLWDASTGEIAERMKGHQYQVTGLTIDDNGDIISSSMDCTLKRWRKGQVVESWEAHKVAIQTVIKLSSGEFLSGSGDSTIKLWRGRTCLHTFVGHSDTVRGLALMPGIGVVSASHDCTVRLWALTGQVLMEMVGHTSLVYSVAACSSGLVASGSEDRFLKIWKDGACIQSIEHPGCVWDVKFLENGDVVTACSDGVVRVWTRQEDRLADLQETEDYLDQLSQYKLSRKTVGGLKLTDLPGLEALQVPGTINGQTMIISEGDNGVAYSWNSKESQWDKIGEVVDGPDDASSGQVYNGTRYDYVFDVDIGDGLPIRKLPYNHSENPYDVADKWLVKENLPLTFREQVVEFILQNSGQKTFTPDPSFRDPYTGANAYVPGESSFASGSVAPKPTFKHIPKAMDFELSKNGNQEATSNHVDDAEASTSGLGNYKHVEEETSPDLLKNTPSNIARLEDVIEQCKARHKYLARTKSPSDGEDVRWYFCKVPLADKELSAAVPKTEIVGKSDYFRFSRRDSLALEASFLQREEELLAYWWREYAECSEGPIGSRSVGKDTELDDLYVVEEERVGVPVKGGLYEVDLMRRHCFPVYWNGENRRVLRGHWYAKSGPDWIPLREDVAEQLELAYHCQVWHRRKFQPSGQFAARVDLLGTSQGAHVLFTGEDNTWEALLVLNGGSTVRLRRGFSVSGSSKPTQDELRQQKEEEMDDYCSQVSVGHLVFMIHGIGQRLEKANLIDDVVDFRRVTTSLAERHLTPYQRSTQRVLFIPCQWRKCLKLSGESAVEKITLHGVRGLRVALGATVHDVLYYMSPIYCQQIIDSVSSQLNSLYMKFLKRNPGYNGKVSLYGHSLGSVLSYDILCHQERLISLFPMDSVSFEAFNDKRDSVDGTCEPVSPTLQPETGDTNISRHVVFSDEIVTHDHNIENGEASGDFKTELEGELGRTAANNVDVVDKDMLISSLEEEVRTLKAKITQLEQYHNTANQTTKNGDSNEINGKEPNSENKHSILRKVSKLQNVKEISYKPFIRYTKLDFKVDTFFAVGSPLGVFLALRNVRIGIGRGQNYWQDAKIQEEFPSCRQMFNIFHPFDPVAYRIEPLVCEEYINIRPVIVPYHRGGNRLHIGFQEFKEDISSVSSSVATHVSSLKEKAINVLRPKGKETIEEEPESFHKNEKSYGSLMMERLTGSEEGRVDHMLQHKTFQHPYIQALGSHTNYWRDYDTALFILKHLYRDIPEEPPSDDSEPIKLFYERDPIEEETPLTFSDRVSVREFSRKARKLLK